MDGVSCRPAKPEELQKDENIMYVVVNKIPHYGTAANISLHRTLYSALMCKYDFISEQTKYHNDHEDVDFKFDSFYCSGSCGSSDIKLSSEIKRVDMGLVKCGDERSEESNCFFEYFVECDGEG